MAVEGLLGVRAAGARGRTAAIAPAASLSSRSAAQRSPETAPRRRPPREKELRLRPPCHPALRRILAGRPRWPAGRVHQIEERPRGTGETAGQGNVPARTRCWAPQSNRAPSSRRLHRRQRPTAVRDARRGCRPSVLAVARSGGRIAAPVGITLEAALYALILVAAVLTRFWDLGSRALHHDESLHAYFSWLLATGQNYAHDPLMHGPFLFHMNAADLRPPRRLRCLQPLQRRALRGDPGGSADPPPRRATPRPLGGADRIDALPHLAGAPLPEPLHPPRHLHRGRLARPLHRHHALHRAPIARLADRHWRGARLSAHQPRDRLRYRRHFLRRHRRSAPLGAPARAHPPAAGFRRRGHRAGGTACRTPRAARCRPFPGDRPRRTSSSPSTRISSPIR